LEETDYPKEVAKEIKKVVALEGKEGPLSESLLQEGWILKSEEGVSYEEASEMRFHGRVPNSFQQRIMNLYSGAFLPPGSAAIAFMALARITDMAWVSCHATWNGSTTIVASGANILWADQYSSYMSEMTKPTDAISAIGMDLK
jgi:hypothetical protein